MRLDKGISVKLGMWEATIYGGPFKNFDPKTRRLIGVKMAVEINHPHDLSIPTRDYSIPSVTDMEVGLKEVFKYIKLGNDIYVGCMGGIGRTGLFMGCLLKCVEVYEDRWVDVDNIVRTVRGFYNAHAIETEEQRDFIGEFDVSSIVETMHRLFDEPKPVVMEKIIERFVDREVVVERVMTPLEWALRMFGLRRWW